MKKIKQNNKLLKFKYFLGCLYRRHKDKSIEVHENYFEVFFSHIFQSIFFVLSFFFMTTLDSQIQS